MSPFFTVEVGVRRTRWILNTGMAASGSGLELKGREPSGCLGSCSRLYKEFRGRLRDIETSASSVSVKA